MKNIHNFIFYSVNKWNKKIMHLSGFVDPSFYPGCMIVALVIIIPISFISAIAGFYFDVKYLWYNYPFTAIIPLPISLIIYFYYGYKKRYLKIYDIFINMEIIKKRRLKLFSILYLIFVFCIFFIFGDIARELNGGEGAFYTDFFIKLLGLD